MQKQIRVTAEDIKLGVGGMPHACPVALAATREFGVPILVGIRNLWKRSDSEGYDIQLPNEARQWIHNFDYGLAVEPIDFIVEVEDAKND